MRRETPSNQDIQRVIGVTDITATSTMPWALFTYSVTARTADTGCPTLFVFGTAECAGPQELPLCGAAMRRLTAAGYTHAAIEIIDGANHGYEGREGELFERLWTWLISLPG